MNSLVAALVRLADAVTTLAAAIGESSLPAKVRAQRHSRAGAVKLKETFDGYRGSAK